MIGQWVESAAAAGLRLSIIAAVWLLSRRLCQIGQRCGRWLAAVLLQMEARMTELNDPYFKRRLTYVFADTQLAFDTAALLASAHEIDPGVDLLLHTLVPTLSTAPQAVLDLACGYGNLGLVLAKLFPSASVTLLDKDLLALRYARHNAALNGLSNVQVVGAVGVRAALGADFDLVVTDLPTKIGDAAIEQDFVLGPLNLLRPGGMVWLVADSQINRLLPGLARKHQLKLTEVIKRRGKTVFTLHRRGV